jgi:hypothetical protein
MLVQLNAPAVEFDLVKQRAAPAIAAKGTPLSTGIAPSELWCADYKGEFKLGNGRYCYPLTVTRPRIALFAFESIREDLAMTAFGGFSESATCHSEGPPNCMRGASPISICVATIRAYCSVSSIALLPAPIGCNWS